MSGADEALVYDTLIALGETEKSKHVFSRMESCKLAGIVVGALIGAVIADKLGVRYPLLFQVIPFTIAFSISLTLHEPAVHEEKEVEAYLKILSGGLKYFMKHKVLVILALDMVLINGLAFLIIWFYQPLLKRVGVYIIYYGIIHSAMALFQIAIIENFVRIEKILGSKKRLITLSALLTGFFFIVLGFSNIIWLTITLVVLSAGFGLSRQPLFISYMNKYIPSDKRATVLSITSMFRTVTAVIVFPIAGILVDWSLAYSMVIIGAIIIVFSSFSKIREEHLLD